MKSITSRCILLALGISLSISMYAQPFEKGDVIFTVGIGLGHSFSYGESRLGLPIGGGVEVGISDAIGIGGEVGILSGSGIPVFYIGPKGYYHFNELLSIPNDKLDAYGGIALYYRHFSFSGSGSLGFSSGIVPGINAGVRYYFTELFSVNAELGNSYAWLKLGTSFRF